VLLGACPEAKPKGPLWLGLLILQAREKKGQTGKGVVYTDGKMLPPPSDRERARKITLGT
jgi:hypothetical protein